MRYFIPAGLLVLAASPAAAQALDGSVEATTDLRERGLSDSAGKGAVSSSAGATLGEFRADVRVATLRQSARHGGADAGATAQLAYRLSKGGLTLDVGGAARLFAGAQGRMDYGEVFATAGYLIGPLQVSGSALYAPKQDAIGGDNLYLRARAQASIPLTPWSVNAHVGHSSGTTRDPLRAARLRPDGSYTDWSVGVGWTLGIVGAEVAYSDTDIDRRRVTSPLGDARNTGEKLTATARIFF